MTTRGTDSVRELRLSAVGTDARRSITKRVVAPSRSLFRFGRAPFWMCHSVISFCDILSSISGTSVLS